MSAICSMIKIASYNQRSGYGYHESAKLVTMYNNNGTNVVFMCLSPPQSVNFFDQTDLV